MAFIETPNAAVTTLVYSVAGREITSNLSWVKSAPFDVDDLQALTGTIVDSWVENLSAIFSTAFQLVTVRGVAQDSETAPTWEQSPDSPTTGSGSGDFMSINTAFNVGWLTGMRGRSYRGLLKHPANKVTWLADKRRWTPAAGEQVHNSYNSFRLDIMADAGLADLQHVVISRYTNEAARPAGVATPVTDVHPYQRVGSLRDRTT